jgi:hypothetical protein
VYQIEIKTLVISSRADFRGGSAKGENGCSFDAGAAAQPREEGRPGKSAAKALCH